MISSATRMGAAVTLAFVLAACDGTDDDAGSASESKSTNRSSVTLIDAGEAPRKKLRLVAKKGTRTHGTMTTKMSVAQSMDGQKGPAIDTPAISMGMLIEATDVSDNGTISTRFSFDSVDAAGDDAQARQIEQLMSSITDMTGTSKTSPTGEVLDTDLSVPADAPDLLKSTVASYESQIQNLAVPLPVEAVGVGATWSSSNPVELVGMKLTNKVQYRVVRFTDDGVELDVTVKQTAPEQDPQLPGLPKGTRAHLDQMTNEGSGRTVLDLASLLPVSAHTTISGTSTTTFSDENGSRKLAQDLTMTMDLASD
jgi:hypothetical protein